MKIAGREISSKLPPYVIAEISGNHAGRFDNAIKLIDAAKEAGADACKLQCFEADRLTLDCDKPDFILKDGPWQGRRLYDLYKATETPRAWFPKLFAHAREVGITLFSSVFSSEDVDFMEGLDCPAYKIASFECNDTALIAYAAKTGKPLIISLGMASDLDLAIAYPYVAEKNVAWLHCISGYPTPIEEANLHILRRSAFADGISDHTLGCDIPIAATALGAVIIEKHLALPGVDSEDYRFSMLPFSREEGDPPGFAEMCKAVRAIWRAMQPSERKSEESSRQVRRSLYVVQDIKQGQPFTSENVRSIRPAYGMPPKELSRVLKSYAARDIERGTALEEGLLLPF